MDEQELKEFLRMQIGEILKHRWLESEKAGKDLGEEAVVDWIMKHAEDFRKWWEICGYDKGGPRKDGE